MILVDTSVWVDHLREGEPHLANLLQASQTLIHPFILGELALGSLQRREIVLSTLGNLPLATEATDEEVLRAIDRWELSGSGIGYIDAHLITAAALTPETRLWTRDKRMRQVAERLGLHAILT